MEGSKFGQLVFEAVTDDLWVQQLQAEFDTKTKPLGTKGAWICLICGVLNYQSKKHCTGFNCWANGCPRAILQQHTNEGMTHTDARAAVKPHYGGKLRKMPVHFWRLDVATIGQTGPLPCQVCGQTYLYNPQFCPCVWTPPLPIANEED